MQRCQSETLSVIEASSRWKRMPCAGRRCCGTSRSLARRRVRCPSEAKDSHPQIPWRGATRLRNRIVHGYWDIDVETLVATAADDLAEMVTELEEAITAMQRLEGSDPSA